MFFWIPVCGISVCGHYGYVRRDSPGGILAAELSRRTSTFCRFLSSIMMTITNNNNINRYYFHYCAMFTIIMTNSRPSSWTIVSALSSEANHVRGSPCSLPRFDSLILGEHSHAVDINTGRPLRFRSWSTPNTYQHHSVAILCQVYILFESVTSLGIMILFN